MRFMSIQSTIERGREAMHNVSGQFTARNIEGGKPVMNICDKCKNYYPNNHYCQYWDCDVTIQHEMCCGFANMTNADRIRTMSDEELANFLTDFSNNGGWTTEIGRKSCYKTITDWLQQSEEEIDDDE